MSDLYTAATAAILLSRGEPIEHLEAQTSVSENPGERLDFVDGSRLYIHAGTFTAIPPGTGPVILRPRYAPDRPEAPRKID